MFTGIIQHVGRIASARPAGAGRRLVIEIGPLAGGVEGGRGLASPSATNRAREPLVPGGSLAVSGVCLTARAVRAALAEFDAVAETVARTTLGALRAGGRVNLERPLRLGDGLDGHLVQGHVDGVAMVRSIDKSGQWLVRFDAPPELTALMVPKGSVALDGVSLTLVDVSDGALSVALIPETLARTTLGGLKIGRTVNVETDLLGRYVRKFLSAGGPGASARATLDGAPPGGLTLERLRRAGFA
jgi:riboflavin synthase